MSEFVGGQAVIEGVMMRNGKKVAVATLKEGKIKVKLDEFTSVGEKYSILKTPFVRGVISLFEMMYLGFKTLTYSANEFAGEEEQITTKELVFTLLFSIVATIGMFVLLPLIFTKLITQQEGFIFHLIDGLFRIGIFILYIWVISFMSDVKRVFEFHGAEHKAINCYEAKLPLTVENVKKQTRLHPRCGTTFIIIVLVVATLIFSLIPAKGFVQLALSRVLLLPVIAGISYEILRLGGKMKNNKVYMFFLAPGLWLQYLTTREPDEKQCETAIKSLEAVL